MRYPPLPCCMRSSPSGRRALFRYPPVRKRPKQHPLARLALPSFWLHISTRLHVSIHRGRQLHCAANRVFRVPVPRSRASSANTASPEAFGVALAASTLIAQHQVKHCWAAPGHPHTCTGYVFSLRCRKKLHGENTFCQSLIIHSNCAPPYSSPAADQQQVM